MRLCETFNIQESIDDWRIKLNQVKSLKTSRREEIDKDN